MASKRTKYIAMPKHFKLHSDKAKSGHYLGSHENDKDRNSTKKAVLFAYANILF